MEHKTFATHMILFGEVVGLRGIEGQQALMFLDRTWRSL